MEPIREKSRGRFLFASVIATTMTVYWLVGMMGTIYFGTSVSSPVTLMWLKYPFNGLGQASTSTIASALVVIIILFPILDVVSAFPLNAVTMANSLFDFLPYTLRKHPKHSKLIRVATRLIAALPPLAAAYGMRSLSNIVDFAGILGFIIMFVTPAALYYKSSVACEQWWGSSGAVTVYFTRGVSTKGDGVVIVVVVVVVVVVVAVVG
jgi:amino acid permease